MRGRGCLLACGAAMVLLALTSEARGGGPSTAPERLTSLPGDEGIPAFAPDGRALVFQAGEAAGRDLALLDLETLEQRWLTRSPETREVEAAWSPDGRTLFFRALSSEGSSIRSLGIDGGRERIIVEAQHKPTRLRVSPRGRLAFSTRESGRTQLWTWREGGSPIRLIDHAGQLSLAGWTADESGLVVRERSVAGQDLWLVAVDGGELRRLTDHPNEEWMAVPSPSSARVAYYTTYERDMTDIRLLSLETGAHTRLTRHPSEDFYPAWSPDDRFIAFLSDRVAKSGLWKVEIDTGVESPILPGVRLGGRPVWSPNGDSIVFQRREAIERIYRVASGGGTPEPVGPNGYEAAAPRVSPDGHRIVFHTTELASEGDLVLLDLESGALSELTHVVDNVKHQSWSPDGTRLVARWSPGGFNRTCDARVLDLEGGETVSLTDAGWLQKPVWCGEHVYYRRPKEPGRGGSEALWRIPVAGGEPRLVVDHPGVETPTDCTGEALLYTLQGPSGNEVRSLRLTGDGSVASDSLVLKDGRDARAAADGRVAFLAEDAHQTDVFVFDPRTGARLRLTRTPWRESAPDWSPDGESIYFSMAEGDLDLWRVNLP